MPASLSSIIANGLALTNAAVITYSVTFSEAVTGVSAPSFFLNPADTDQAAQVTGVSGSGAIIHRHRQHWRQWAEWDHRA